MFLTGGLVSALNTSIAVGDPTRNVFTLAFFGDGSVLTTASGAPLLSFQGSSVTSAGGIFIARRSLPGQPTLVGLSGPLFVANGSSFSTTSLGAAAQFGIAPTSCCPGFGVGEGAILASSTPSPLLQLVSSSFNAGPDARSGGNLFSVFDHGNDPAAITAPAQVALTGPLLSMTDSSLTALNNVFGMTRSNFFSASSDPLVQVLRSSINVGGFDPISGQNQFGAVVSVRSSDVSGTPGTDAGVFISGPLLNATNSSITSSDLVLRLFNGAQFASLATTPLITLVNTTMNLGSSALANSGRVVNVFGTGGPDGVTRSSVILNGALLLASGGSTINSLSGLVGATDGEIIASSAGPDPFIRLIGGNHSLASATNTAMFTLGFVATAPTVTQIVDGVTLNLGTFAPLSWSGAGGGLLRLDSAQVSGQKAFRIDTALFQATAPVFDLAGSTLTVAPTTAVDGGLMDLNFQAKVVSFGPVARLDGSTITVTNNHAFRVAGGSLLQVVGDFLSLNNGSVLQALNGSVMRITGGSVVNISGAFAIFGAGPNQIKVSNALCGTSCITLGGIPIAFTNNASTAQVTVTGSALKNAGAGSIVQSGPAAAVIVVDGTISKLTIKGQ